MIGCKKDWPITLKADEIDLLINLLLSYKTNNEVKKEIKVSILNTLENAEAL